ncbi:hypothetical protein [Paraburkholderia caledonica]|uniref:DUF91 domain-containing protein n=1 Tax=Paraburkholderia caledonica TaxID=134536 RepID=A0ABU1KTC5_9BURK|nr:hypothetical protein [Paraburkholderia caledonica]MDR6374174.1 hypothetical protein [Paraburkholderia caledonica]
MTTIPQLAEQLNQRAARYKIGKLQHLRVKLKDKKRLPSRKIFLPATISEDWAFHYGGRAELQFNIGMEESNGKRYIRHGVAFSLEPSQTLPRIDALLPKMRLFNEFLRTEFNALEDFRIWYFRKGVRSDTLPLAPLAPELFQTGTFVFMGALAPIDQMDLDRILRDFDRLLPLYIFVESGGNIPPDKTFPTAFTFRAGNHAKSSWAVASLPERQLSIELRHNALQSALYSELCMEYGPENIGTEISNGGGGRIDAVARSVDGYIFFEIKIGQSLKSCIREAIGQLLEYSYWPGANSAKELVIVGEAVLDGKSNRYIETLKRSFNLPISYRRVTLGDEML